VPVTDERQGDENVSEIKQLQRCIRDLVSVLSLPAVWTGTDTSIVANTLLDVLSRMLRLDFAYLRTTSEPASAAKEWARSASVVSPKFVRRIG
jgi:hypothetical protein